MRVIHVTPYFAPAFVYGGPPRSILALCQGLREAGVEVEVITTVANGASDLPATRPGETVMYDGIPVHYARRRFPPVFFNADVQAPIRAALARADVCHIHGLWTVPAWQAARAATRLGVPFVISPRGMLHPAALKRRAWKKRIAFKIFERQHLRDAAVVHATVEEEATILRQFVPSPARIVTIPNAVDVDLVDRTGAGARQRLGLPADAPLVVFLGRLHPIKRLDLLVEAFAAVCQRHPAAVLVLAGPDEGGLQRIADPVARLGNAVRIAGALDDADKWALLREATALVLCSDSENFGVSVVEAMASGCPVVATETCPWQELEAEGAGRWVPQDARAIADAVSAIVGDPALKAAMGERGRRLARTRYARKAVGTAMARCYADILSVRRRVA